MRHKQAGAIELFGRFISQSKSFPPVDGRLLRRGTRLQLESSPRIESPISVDTTGSLFEVDPEIRADVLEGQTDEGPVSLIYVQSRESPSSINLPQDYAIKRTVYRVGAVLKGVHLGSVNRPGITSAEFEFDQLRNWLPSQDTQLTRSTEAISIVKMLNVPPFLDFHSASNNARFEVCARTDVRYNTTRGALLKKRVVVTVFFEEPVSYRAVLNVEDRVQEFLAVLAGTVIVADTVNVTTDAGDGYLYRSDLIKGRKVYAPACVRPEATQLTTAWTGWLTRSPSLRPFERLFFSSLRNIPALVENEFQTLAQALESFHRLAVGGNMKAKDRIRNLVLQLTPASVTSLLGDGEAFVNETVDTRDVLIHAGLTKPYALSDAADLYLANQKMRALLRLLVLTHVGMSESHAIEACVRQAERYHRR